MSLRLAIDFGSTYTKAALFDLERRRVIGSGYAPSTVGSDVREGLEVALQGISSHADLRSVPCLACSSAAGGLRIVTIGLVPSLSLEAARRAALGAGAKVVGAYGYKISPSDLDDLARRMPDILLLAGGIDGGDEDTILHNAHQLALRGLKIPVIVAGNKSVSAACGDVLRDAGVDASVEPNILPEIDKLDVEPVHRKIRDIFMERIVHAKGIDKVRDDLNLVGPIIPTPRAILEAAQLLSEGVEGEKGAGDVVVIDIGGATTDVHSIASGAPRTPGVVPRGLPELRAKRTVEGDLGMRINAPTVLQRAGSHALMEKITGLGSCDAASAADIEAYVARIEADTAHLPTAAGESTIDAGIGACAAELAMIRHAGALKEVYTPNGTVLVQEGKDLTGTRMLIGVGGVVARGAFARPILESALRKATRPFSLCPENPKLYVDRHYVLFGVGVLARDFPAQALAIAREQLAEV